MQIEINMTLAEATTQLQEKMQDELRTAETVKVTIAVPSPRVSHTNKIAAIKRLREIVSIMDVIEDRPLATSIHAVNYGATPSGRYIGLAHAKMVVEELMTALQKP